MIHWARSIGGASDIEANHARARRWAAGCHAGAPFCHPARAIGSSGQRYRSISKWPPISRVVREGGAVYGSHIFVDVHYCSNGQYILSGESRRQTVLDNWQVNRWEDSGRWAVLRVEGRVGVRATSRSGKVEFVAAELLPDGRLWVGDGVSVRLQGPAICR